MFFGAKSGGQGRQGKGKAGRAPVKPVSEMGGTGYQPVPLGNLPSGMEGSVRCETNARLASGGLTLPPGW